MGASEDSIANTPYENDIVRAFVDACRKHGMKVGFYFSPEDFLFMHRQGHDITRNSRHANISTNPGCIHAIRPGPVIREGDIWFTRSAADKGTVYVIIPQGETLWKRGERHEFTLRSLGVRGGTRISVLGQNSRVVEYQPEADPESRFAQTADGLWISVVRAQRLYNDHKWPNPVVVKLEGVAFTAEDD